MKQVFLSPWGVSCVNESHVLPQREAAHHSAHHILVIAPYEKCCEARDKSQAFSWGLFKVSDMIKKDISQE